MTYGVFTLPSLYKEVILKLSPDEQERIKRLADHLKDNPYAGDQLQIKVLREKRINEKRLYYFVFEDLKAVFIVAISNKKTQQKTIDTLISQINNYRNYLLHLMKKD